MPAPLDLPTAFNALIGNFLRNQRQQQIGERRQAGKLPIVHYNYRWHGVPITSDIIFVRDAPPQEALAALHHYEPVATHRLIVVEQEPALREAYVEAGYSLHAVDYLMARPVQLPPPPTTRHVVRRATLDDLSRLNEVEGMGEIRAEDLRNPALAHYFVRLDGKTVARGRTARHGLRLSWVSDLYTMVAYRRRGTATTIMQRLLADNAVEGLAHSALLSSEAGHLLYKRLGYRTLATMLTFEPARG